MIKTTIGKDATTKAEIIIKPKNRNIEADKLIEALGPKVAEDMIRKYINQVK